MLGIECQPRALGGKAPRRSARRDWQWHGNPAICPTDLRRPLLKRLDKSVEWENAVLGMMLYSYYLKSEDAWFCMYFDGRSTLI